MTAADIQRIIDDLALELRRSVVVDDPDILLLQASPHYDDEDPARIRAVLQRDAGAEVIAHVLASGVRSWHTPGVVPARPDLGLKPRLCVPVRLRTELVGFLMVVVEDDAPAPGRPGGVSAEDLLRLMDTAKQIAPLLAGADEIDHGDLVVADLLHPSPHRRDRAVQDLAVDERARWVLVADVLTRVPTEDTDRRIRRTWVPGAMQWSQLDGPRARIVLAAPTPEILAGVDGLAAGRLPGSRIGIGEVVDGLGRAMLSARQAELARARAEIGRVGAEPSRTGTGSAGPTATEGGVLRWSDLGADAVLIPWVDQGSAELLPPQVQRLLAVDPDRLLSSTVLTYLDHAGAGPAAAAALHIHRTTLYYRLGRVTELTGLDLGDGRTRLALHAGLTALALLEQRS